ncbi:putative E3 ubiquitin ligase SUD1 [Drosera capensis]
MALLRKVPANERCELKAKGKGETRRDGWRDAHSGGGSRLRRQQWWNSRVLMLLVDVMSLVLLCGLGLRELIGRTMGDHLILPVDDLIIPEMLQPSRAADFSGSTRDGTSVHQVAASSSLVVEDDKLEVPDGCDETERLLQVVECRICQEEDSVNNLEDPCACCGSLKFAHRKCVQKWINEKGNATCEICHQPYKSGYTVPSRPEETTIDIRQVYKYRIGACILSIHFCTAWTISGAPVDLNDPRILAIAAEQRLLEAEYDEYADSNASGRAFFRSAALVLMALLLLRHALALTDPDGDDDVSAFFSIFLLRAAGFLLPCYIMAWAISILQRRRRSQEEAALAAREVAYVLHTGQSSGLQVTIAPGPAPVHRQEILQ